MEPFEARPLSNSQESSVVFRAFDAPNEIHGVVVENQPAAAAAGGVPVRSVRGERVEKDRRTGRARAKRSLGHIHPRIVEDPRFVPENAVAVASGQDLQRPILGRRLVQVHDGGDHFGGVALEIPTVLMPGLRGTVDRLLELDLRVVDADFLVDNRADRPDELGPEGDLAGGGAEFHRLLNLVDTALLASRPIKVRERDVRHAGLASAAEILRPGERVPAVPHRDRLLDKEVQLLVQPGDRFGRDETRQEEKALLAVTADPIG